MILLASESVVKAVGMCWLAVMSINVQRQAFLKERGSRGKKEKQKNDNSGTDTYV